MFKILRIVCTVLAALLLAFIIPAIVLIPKIYALIAAIFALLFFVLMMLFKSLQEQREAKENPAPEKNRDENTHDEEKQ